MNIIKLSLLGMSLLATAAIAHADDKPYGPAGCGFGSVIMGKDGNIVLSMTTNDASTQTFAISSGTSNCVDGGMVKKKKQVRVFIEMNRHQLADDISKGGGETVSGLAKLYNCTDEQALSSALQKHFQVIFPSANTSVSDVDSAIQHVISTEFKKSCVG